MLAHTISRKKINFWLVWSIANAIGLGFAWSLGELIGRQAAEIFGWKIGQIIGIIIFEGFLWIIRAAVLLRIKSFEILRPIEILIWVTTEIFGWLISEQPIPKDNIMSITGGAMFASSMGAMAWIIFWFIKIPKPRSKLWAIQAFLWTFLGLIGGSFLMALIQVTGMAIAEILAKMYFPIIGMAIGGTVLGGLLGSITGLALVNLMRWQTTEI